MRYELDDYEGAAIKSMLPYKPRGVEWMTAVFSTAFSGSCERLSRWSTPPLSACISTERASPGIGGSRWDGHGVNWPARFMCLWIQTDCRYVWPRHPVRPTTSACWQTPVSPEGMVNAACRPRLRRRWNSVVASQCATISSPPTTSPLFSLRQSSRGSALMSPRLV